MCVTSDVKEVALNVHLYKNDTGFVEIISETVPEMLEGYSVYQYEGTDLIVDSIFEYNIYVVKDAAGTPAGVAFYKMPPQASYFLQKLVDKDAQIADLQAQLAAAQEAINFLLGL